MCRQTHLIKHVLFPGFYIHGHASCSVHFDHFMFLPHGITWSTWSYKRFTDRLHAPNHTTCIMQCSYRCSSPIHLPSALCSLPSSFPLSSLDLMTPNPPVSLPFTLFTISHSKTALSSLLIPSSFSIWVLAFSFPAFTDLAFLISLLLFSLPAARRWKVWLMILLYHEKLPA